MESMKRRHFPDAFKRDAVERARKGGLTIIQVAEELGLHETVLRRRMRRFDRAETAAENARLKLDLHKG
jgi:transposase